ncbi:phasin [Phreatobacter aquaticus]|uniref:Phasin n=1 Tax=Phreatobacter aquaticus TaxID=2570229 RepID=A0A4D7QBX9_9HYPH|nr:phasin [Phreatobacter aquaticus]QCK85520.1 phasin [Phreatobacter aquaticus]
MVETRPGSYEIPQEMREFADKSVEQARKAFDGFVGAAHRTVDAMESSAEVLQTGAHDVGRKAIAIAETNVAASFAFAQKLVRATDMVEVMQIQAEFLQSQMEAMRVQAKELGSTFTAKASGKTPPKSP